MEMKAADSAELARTITQESGASSITVFLVDSEDADLRVRYLFNLGLSIETNRQYQESICGQDPFLIAGCRFTPPRGAEMLILEQGQVQSIVPERSARSYWSFMNNAGYAKTAASIQTLTPGLQLVAGVMWQAQEGVTGRSMEPLRATLSKLFDGLSATLIRNALRQFWFEPKAVLPETLTHRERDVVAALCRGLSNKQIAAALDLSEFTIENHLRRIYRKHGVRNRTSLMARFRTHDPAAAEWPSHIHRGAAPLLQH